MLLFFILNKLLAYRLVLATALLVSYLANVFIRAVIERVSRFR